MSQNSLHIEFEKITDLITGMLSSAEQRELAAHLETCPDCAILKEQAQKNVEIMRSDRLEEVPPHILERTFALLREKKPTPAKPSLVDRIIAVLQTEDSILTPAFGLRSGQTNSIRRLWLTADMAEIDLRLEPAGEMWTVTGQVFGDFTGGEGVLQNDEAELHAPLSDLCEFSFTGVLPGVYKMTLRLTDVEIEIPEVKIER